MIYLAFPGMGKTPLAKANGKFIDFDFGHFRQAMNKSKDNEQTLMPAFVRLMRLYERDGFIVLSNDPKIMEFTRVNKVFLPTNLSYSARKMNVSEGTVQEWVHDWEQQAQRCEVPVTYVSKGLDHYLQSQSRTHKRKGGR